MTYFIGDRDKLLVFLLVLRVVHFHHSNFKKYLDGHTVSSKVNILHAAVHTVTMT